MLIYMQAATRDAASQIGNIIDAIEGIERMVGSIVAASREQTDAVLSVVGDADSAIGAFDELSEALQSNAMSASTTHATAESVTRATEEIDQSTGRVHSVIKSFFAKIA